MVNSYGFFGTPLEPTEPLEDNIFGNYVAGWASKAFILSPALSARFQISANKYQAADMNNVGISKNDAYVPSIESVSPKYSHPDDSSSSTKRFSKNEWQQLRSSESK